MANGQKKKRIPMSRQELNYRGVKALGGVILRAQKTQTAQTQAQPQSPAAEPEPEEKITPPTN